MRPQETQVESPISDADRRSVKKRRDRQTPEGGLGQRTLFFPEIRSRWVECFTRPPAAATAASIRQSCRPPARLTPCGPADKWRRPFARADGGRVVAVGLHIVGHVFTFGDHVGHRFSSRSAAASSFRCRSISMPDRIRAVGLTLFCPLYLGALPWVASKTAPSGPILAPGPLPIRRPARRQVAQNVAVQIGQHEHVIISGFCTSCMHMLSTIRSSKAISG